MLNISSIKELLHKPSEIQWNTTGTLPGRLKRNFLWFYPTRYYSLKSQKTWDIAIFWGNLGLGTNVEFNDFLWFCKFLKVSASIFWLKNSFKFKLGFSLILNILQGVSSEKNILCSDWHGARWYWCKKDQKKLSQTSHRICHGLIVNSSLLWALWFKTFVKIHFQGVKVEKWHSCN